MKILFFPENSCNPCFYATVQRFRLVDCYTVTFNSPGYDIKRPGKYLFSIKFISSFSSNSCSDKEGLVNRIN